MSTSSKTFIVFLSFMFLFSYGHGANSTLTPGQSLRDATRLPSSKALMISPSKTFAFGFFSPDDSRNRYLGIWYNKIPGQTVVWVANRDNPITDSSGVLLFGDDGNLVVQDGSGRSLWSSNTSNPRNSATLFLMDTGNLVLSIGEVPDPDRALWQSFNDPTDTYLPEMKARLSPRRRKDLFTSWKSESDPSRGNFSAGLDPQGLLEFLAWRGAEKYWRSGLWDGHIFVGLPSMTANYMDGFRLLDDESFTYIEQNDSEIVRFRLRWNGTIEKLHWDEGNKEWRALWAQPTGQCDVYNTCGAYGICHTSALPICSCLRGFKPKLRSEWDNGNWSGGCVRRMELQCERNISSLGAVPGDKFLEMDGLKLPDMSVLRSGLKNRKDCEAVCSNNCSCKAYAYVTGIGCLTWVEEFVDVSQFQEGGQTFYLRLAASELGTRKSKMTLIIVLVVVFGIILSCTSAYILLRCRAMFPKEKIEVTAADESRTREYRNEFPGQDDVEGNNRTEVKTHSFLEILNATNNFSYFSKLGEGGFGPVYKGKLPCGLDVAVKRLSRQSCQGLEEFKNEIILIAKLQHRNLVRLIGYCVEGEEKILVYEYLPNKSLDTFIFGNSQEKLTWDQRFSIIQWIARGLLYLHRDSRLRIIHRDLKTSNILLDEELNPKISDFGMAKIFGGSQNEANTNRIVGTYGYMAPEFAMEGLFSVKSDVYSFGVVLLEIISGKNNKYRHYENSANLVGYAWKLWSEERAMEFIDPSVGDSCLQSDALRCLNIGLLCVQDSAMDRPIMSTVVLMLESEIAILSTPKQPTFTMGKYPTEIELSSDSSKRLSQNSITHSMVLGR